ncbi:MAG: hypothetical protein M3186_17645 [Actinomycetota bacterium]|nr:hypothetical protein [Actinomycetota bacterium]
MAPEHSKPVVRSEHGPRTRGQRVRKDETERHDQTPLRCSLDRHRDNRGVLALALHPVRHRPTTAHRMTDEDDQALMHRRQADEIPLCWLDQMARASSVKAAKFDAAG